jgi:hypothetical protein
MRAAGWLLILFTFGCVKDGLTFTCDQTHSCGPSKTCIQSACAAVASDCPSGLRFDPSANNGRGGKCVDTSAGDMGACVSQGPEDCFNGVDDDCNGFTDCADPACSSVAMCTADIDGAVLGVKLAAADTCPAGFPDETVVNQGLSGGNGCVGCTCANAACLIDVRRYSAAANCPTGVKTLLGTASSQACTSMTFACDAGGTDASFDTSVGYSATSCAPSGTAKPDTPSWTTTAKVCAAHRKGAGCGAGRACIPKTLSTIVALGPSTQTCSGSYSAVMGGAWYTSYSDPRTCGACSCGAVSGANCAQAKVAVWSTMFCNTGGSGLSTGLNCNVGNSFCGAGYQTANVNLFNSVEGTCPASSAVLNALTPTGQQTLCTQ